ncbi:MAG: hypothetical protein RLP02_24885 [Coleofasciculus sp. C2-GNP5-27]|uniref:hypothetical protein n=1 Tax=Pelagibacterium sp. TaxID=1967288 RepID=UPI0032F07758
MNDFSPRPNVTYATDGKVYVGWKQENGNGAHVADGPNKIEQKVLASELSSLLSTEEMDDLIEVIRAKIAAYGG